MKSAHSQQFGQLRSRIEAACSGPTLIVVTSAVRGDGKTVTAFGLAESFAAAQHRVLLVDANTEAPTLPRVHHVSAPQFASCDYSRQAVPVSGQAFDGISLADQRFEDAMSMESVRGLAANLRENFDFIIIDAPRLVKSNLAVLFATIADATLLTLRFGRMPSQADGRTMATLNKVGAKVLGVLTVEPAMMKAFAIERQAAVSALRVPARPITSRHSMGPEKRTRPITEAIRERVTSDAN